MENSSRFVADLAGWRLTQAVDSDQSASALLQASLAFPAVAGPRIGNAGRMGADDLAVQRWLATGSLQLRAGSPARAILTGSVRGADAGYCMVEAALPREQFEWLLSLVDQPHCDVQLEFELPALPLAVDAQGKASAELVNPRYWVTTTCGAGTLDVESLTARLDAARSMQLGSSALPAGASLAQMEAEQSQPTTLQPALDSDADSGHDQQEGGLHDVAATAGPAATDKLATAPQEDDDAVAASPWPTDMTTPPPTQAAEPDAARPLPAATAPATPTTAPASKVLAIDGLSSDESSSTKPATDESGPAFRPSLVDEPGVVGSMASSALPEPGPDIVAPVLESLPEQATAADSLRLPADTQPSTVGASLDLQRGLHEEASAQDREPIDTSDSPVAAAAPEPAVPPPMSPEIRVDAGAAPTLSSTPALAEPPVGPPPARSSARLPRPALGLALTVLLVIAIGGYWFANRSVESAAKPEVASAPPAPSATAQPPAMPSSPASNVVTQAAPVTMVSTSETKESPAATVETTTQDKSTGDQGQTLAAVPVAPASPTPTEPEQVATEAKPPAPTKPSAAVRKSAPKTAPRARDAGRSRTPSRAATMAKSSEPEKAKPPPLIAPATVPTPPVAISAPAAPPIEKTQIEPAAPLAAPDPCRGLAGLKLAQCRSCAGLGTARRYVCERSVVVRYCAGKWGDVPDCAWQSTAGEDSNYALKP